MQLRTFNSGTDSRPEQLCLRNGVYVAGVINIHQPAHTVAPMIIQFYHDNSGDPSDFKGFDSASFYSWAERPISMELDKSLSIVDGLPLSTTPIAATDSMLNPVFTVPAGKQMVFSGWVREGTVDTAYKHNSVQIQFDDGEQAVM